MKLLLMCLEFFKTGLLSIGGGLATLPFLFAMADKYPWFTRDRHSDMIAVSESTPGPIGINMATFAGYTTAGVPGAVLATFSLVLPSILVILIVARFLKKFQDSKLVRRAMDGLRGASVGLIAAAGLGILKLALSLDLDGGPAQWVDYRALGVLLVIWGLYKMFGKKLHPIAFIGMGAAAGLVLGL